MVSKPPDIGVVGLGRLGLTVACRLSRLGGPINGYNRHGERGNPLKALGGALYESPAHLASESNIIITAVTGPRDCVEVLIGRSGVIKTGRSGTVVIDLSTIDPNTSRMVAGKLRGRGIDMLDAPVTGSLHDAERGTLGLLVGGDKKTLNRVRPILKKFASNVYHFGSNGAGCSAKLALNLLVAAMVGSLGESLALLRALNLDQQLFLKAIATSGLASPLFERAGTRALAADLTPKFALRDLYKDITLMNKLSCSEKTERQLARTLRRVLSRHLAEYGDCDYSALIAATIGSVTTNGQTTLLAGGRYESAD
jgi:3-hydroxyisobutyrate dehydrogenase